MAVAVGIRIRFFARLREQAGVETESLQVPPESTVADVYAAVRRRHPALESDTRGVRGAVNQEFAGWDAHVSADDEVAFIPPVSGGSPRAL